MIGRLRTFNSSSRGHLKNGTEQEMMGAEEKEKMKETYKIPENDEKTDGKWKKEEVR